MLTLYTMRKITKGTLHASRLILVTESTENSQTGRIISVVLCPHCGKDPMRGIWQFYFAFFTQRIDQLCDTVINMFVHKKSAGRFTKPTYRGTSHPCREIDWDVFSLCTINCIRMNKETIPSLAGVAFNCKGFRNTKGQA